jgi:hypothetical protein
LTQTLSGSQLGTIAGTANSQTTHIYEKNGMNFYVTPNHLGLWMFGMGWNQEKGTIIK